MTTGHLIRPKKDHPQLVAGWSPNQCAAGRGHPVRAAIFQSDFEHVEVGLQGRCGNNPYLSTGPKAEIRLIAYLPLIDDEISRYITNKRGRLVSIINPALDRYKIFGGGTNKYPMVSIINIDSNQIISAGVIDGWESIGPNEVDIFYQVDRPVHNYYEFIQSVIPNTTDIGQP